MYGFMSAIFRVESDKLMTLQHVKPILSICCSELSSPTMLFDHLNEIETFISYYISFFKITFISGL